jgi:hypothetical protein
VKQKNKAAVHCVIIGFALFSRNEKFIFDNDIIIPVSHINPYLIDAPDIIVYSRNKPLYDVPQMVYGNKPADGGNLIIEDKDYAEFIKSEPNAKKFIRPLLGAEEYINNKKRWVLWLVDAAPKELLQMSKVMERIEKCRQMRLASVAAAIRKFAETPTRFAQVTQPAGIDYILVPRVSSERRRYVPIGFLTADTIVSDAVQIIPNAEIYHFGILTSNVHMAWMRVVCGRLKSDYRYSKDIVYNNFPWCEPNEKQKAKIEETAQAVLDARAAYPEASLADLYGENMYLYPKLLTAHQNNDRAVMQAYGFSLKMSESECVAELMRLYQMKITEQS